MRAIYIGYLVIGTVVAVYLFNQYETQQRMGLCQVKVEGRAAMPGGDGFVTPEAKRAAFKECMDNDGWR